MCIFFVNLIYSNLWITYSNLLIQPPLLLDKPLHILVKCLLRRLKNYTCYKVILITGLKRGERNYISTNLIDEPPLIKKFILKKLKVSKKFLKRQSQSIKKSKKIYSQLVKSYKKSSKDLLCYIKKNAYPTYKVVYKIIVILVCIINLYSNIDIAKASSVYETSIVRPDKTIISGDIASYQKTSKLINPYLAYNISHHFNSDKNIVQQLDKIVYINKPKLTDTQSREAIEEQKRAEELEKQRLEYQSYLAQNTQYTQSQRNVVVRDHTEERAEQASVNHTNTYYYGYCTWYVANRRNVPNQWGNGGQWFYSAQASGYPTGHNPSAGAILVTSESGWGHVAIVENVEGEYITISEMNFAGWGIVNTRQLHVNSPQIIGYIY